jgi:hypothetical protein
MITICPPGNARGSEPEFQFQKHGFHPVERSTFDAEGTAHNATGFSFSDMHQGFQALQRKLMCGRVSVHSCWYSNSDCLKILTRALERRSGWHARKCEGSWPERFENAQRHIEQDRLPALIRQIDSLCSAYVRAKNNGGPQVYLESLQRRIAQEDQTIRNYMKAATILAGIIWWFYRCGYNSVQTAQQLGVSSCSVRQTVFRLNNVAQELGLL